MAKRYIVRGFDLAARHLVALVVDAADEDEAADLVFARYADIELDTPELLADELQLLQDLVDGPPDCQAL